MIPISQPRWRIKQWNHNIFDTPHISSFAHLIWSVYELAVLIAYNQIPLQTHYPTNHFLNFRVAHLQNCSFQFYIILDISTTLYLFVCVLVCYITAWEILCHQLVHGTLSFRFSNGWLRKRPKKKSENVVNLKNLNTIQNWKLKHTHRNVRHFFFHIFFCVLQIFWDKRTINQSQMFTNLKSVDFIIGTVVHCIFICICSFVHLYISFIFSHTSETERSVCESDMDLN